MSLILPRRSVLGGLAGATLLQGRAVARTGEAARSSSMPIWKDHAPGGAPDGIVEKEVPRSPAGPADDTAFLHVTSPCLLHCRPSKPNGAAILLIPGGGYTRVAIGRGGAELLRAFAGAGYSAYLLKYRLPGDPWAAGANAPLQDAQRALQVVAWLADQENFDAGRIAVCGGSAGGHLAARLANTRSRAYDPVDALDASPAAVRAAILLYPVNLMTGDHAHLASRRALLAHTPAPNPAAYAAEASIGPGSPPTFLVHALDDTVVSVENSISYFMALRAARIASELRVQESGGHGFGWNQPNSDQAWDWPALALRFIQRHGA